MRTMLRALVVIACCAASAAGPAAQQPGRDGTAPPVTGTAVISGRLVTDDATPSPVRRARVMLNSTEGGAGFTIIGDDEGRFSFPGLPAGRYLLSARKDGYLRANYGAARPERPGTPIAVADGQRVIDLVFRITRGAVITGMVVNAIGEPAEDAGVVALRRRVVRGEPQLEEEKSATTDDRGVYRIWGLPPGDYVVATTPRFRHDVQNLRETTASDVRWATGQLQPGAGSSGRAPLPEAQPVGFAPVFFPGAINALDGTVITLSAGEERLGINFPIRLVPMLTIEGTVANADGTAPGEVSLYMMPAGTAPDLGFSSLRETAGARFRFEGVTPGDYVVVARTEGARLMWATATVNAYGNVSGLGLTLQPGLTVSGRVVFAGTKPAPDFTTVRVRIEPIPGTQRLSFEPDPATVKADGRFEIPNLVPGKYRLSAGVGEGPPTQDAAWVLASVVANQRNVTDLPLEIAPAGNVTDAVVTLTDRSSQLVGTLQDAARRPAPDFYVIAFPADRRFWIRGSRRIQSVRPATDGSFLFRALPPGEYLLAALTDVEPDEWFDPAFLAQLAGVTIPVTIAEGETKVQDLKIR
jgi:hypothetical protein